MDIQQIIDQLSAAQLEDIAARARERQAALEQEERIPLWVLIEDRMINLAAFPEDQYPRAVARMIAAVEAAARENPNLPIALELKRQYVQQSQVDSLLALGRKSPR
jgi:hypothetical protein